MKAILVMDMPERCENCPLLFAGTYCKGKKSPNIAVNSYLDKTKPEWCPLKELPQKPDYPPINESSYVAGYNACIDKILEGSGEDE